MGVDRVAERTERAARAPTGAERLVVADLVGAGVLVVAAIVVSRTWLLDAAPYFAERDAGFNAVGMNNLQHALSGDGDWRHAPLAWPLPNGTTQADWMLGQALLTLPMSRWVDPSRIYELASFSGLVLTAWAGMVLARLLVGAGPHTWLAGLVVGLGPLQLAHAQHANLVHHELAVLGPLLVGIGLRAPRAGVAALGGLLTAGALHFGLYMGLHALLGTVVVGVWAAVSRSPASPPAGPRSVARGARAWAGAALGVAVGLASLVPVGLLYLRASAGTSIPRSEVVADSWDPASSFALARGAPLHALLGELSPFALLHGVDPPNPGFLVFGLALLGLARSRAVRGAVPLLCAAVLGAALALGPEPRVWAHALPFPGPSRLLELVVGENLREPRRWLFWAQIATGVFASAGLARLLAGLPRAARPWLSGAVLLAVITELPGRPEQSAQATREGLCLLDDAPQPGPLFEAFGQCNCSGTLRLRAALFHRRPLVGGNFARFSEPSLALNRLARTFPAPATIELLRAAQVRTTLEHPPLRGAPPEGAVCAERDGHRLCTLPARRAVPAPTVVTEEVNGPIVGVRWPDVRDAGATRGSRGPSPTIRVRCGEGATEVHHVAAWQVLAQARGVATFDVFLEQPCAAGVVTEPPGSVPLYVSGDDPGWLPPVPAAGPGMDALLDGACTERG